MSEHNWIYEEEQLKNTPSRRQGLSAVEEHERRINGVKAIMDIGTKLNLLANPTLYTATVYFHRFYMFYSFEDYNYLLTALGCLFLAGKVEETPKKIKDITFVAKDLYVKPYALHNITSEGVINFEKILLRTLKFDLKVENPYDYLLQYIKIFKLSREETHEIVQTAWTFINDSAYTTLVLLWEIPIISLGMIHMTLELKHKNNVDYEGKDDKDHGPWWNKFVGNLDLLALEKIGHKVLDHYIPNNPTNHH